MSESTRALETVRYNGKNLPKDWPYNQWAKQQRQRRERDSRIFRDFLAAEDKKQIVVDLAGRWGLRIGDIYRVIEKMNVDGAIISHMAADVEVLRQRKREQIISDSEKYREELIGQIMHFEAMRKDGSELVEVEVTDKTGDKEGTSTKRVPLLGHIKSLKQELSKSYRDEAEALSLYIPKPTVMVEHRGEVLHTHAAAEFKEQFDRLNGLESGMAIDTDAEIVE